MGTRIAGGLPGLIEKMQSGNGTARLSTAEFNRLRTRQAKSDPTSRLKFVAEANEGAGSAASIRADGVIELLFDGAELASWNDVMRAHWTSQNAYASCWHRLVKRALSTLDAQPMLATCRIEVIRIAKRELDIDNISPKAVIDGMRYAKIFRDDTPYIVKRVETDQQKGETAVIARIIPLKN